MIACYTASITKTPTVTVLNFCLWNLLVFKHKSDHIIPASSLPEAVCYLALKVSRQHSFPASTSRSLPTFPSLPAHPECPPFSVHAVTLSSLSVSSSSFSLPETSSPICLLRAYFSFRILHKCHLSVRVTISLPFNSVRSFAPLPPQCGIQIFYWKIPSSSIVAFNYKYNFPN